MVFTWTDWHGVAPGEGVAGVSRRAAADGVVVDHLAKGPYSTRSRARVHALVVKAGLRERALRAHYTLGATLRGASYHTSLTRAHCYSVVDLAEAVGAAWRRLAWVHNWRRWKFSNSII